MIRSDFLQITPEILGVITRIDEFKFVREQGRITMGGAIRLTGGNRNTLKQYFAPGGTGPSCPPRRQSGCVV